MWIKSNPTFSWVSSYVHFHDPNRHAYNYDKNVCLYLHYLDCSYWYHQWNSWFCQRSYQCKDGNSQWVTQPFYYHSIDKQASLFQTLTFFELVGDSGYNIKQDVWRRWIVVTCSGQPVDRSVNQRILITGGYYWHSRWRGSSSTMRINKLYICR